MGKTIRSVSIAGTGNVATQLSRALKQHGVAIDAIYGRNPGHSDKLADSLGCEAVHDIARLPDSDLVLVCVSDDAIASVLGEIPSSYAVAYTSGSVRLQDMPQRSDLGVFYPLQTFSKQRTVDLFEVPFLVEAVNTEFAASLFDLAWMLSRKVQFASSEERKHLHLGAVMVNNFTNHLAYLAKTYLDRHQLDWELLKPLMAETQEKLKATDPFDAQTGPARRNDKATITEHISMLEGLPKEIYDVISRSIRKTYNPDETP